MDGGVEVLRGHESRVVSAGRFELFEINYRVPCERGTRHIHDVRCVTGVECGRDSFRILLVAREMWLRGIGMRDAIYYLLI